MGERLAAERKAEALKLLTRTTNKVARAKKSLLKALEEKKQTEGSQEVAVKKQKKINAMIKFVEKGIAKKKEANSEEELEKQEEKVRKEQLQEQKLAKKDAAAGIAKRRKQVKEAEKL